MFSSVASLWHFTVGISNLYILEEVKVLVLCFPVPSSWVPVVLAYGLRLLFFLFFSLSNFCRFPADSGSMFWKRKKPSSFLFRKVPFFYEILKYI